MFQASSTNMNLEVKYPIVKLTRLNVKKMNETIKPTPKVSKDVSDDASANDLSIKDVISSTDGGVHTRSSKRKRNEVDSADKNINKPLKPKTRRTKRLTLKEKIDIDAPESKFMVDEIVFATIPGFCPWPARITGILNEMIMVEFFGTGEVYVELFCIGA